MKHLVRNAPAVKSNLIATQAGAFMTKVPCKIQVPVRFAEIGLAEISVQTFIYGLFAIILDSGEYSVMNVNALVEISPDKIARTTIDDTEYYEFLFNEGSVVIKTKDVVCRETMMYNVLDEFFFKGKLPWYTEYDDVGKIFDTALKYASSNVGNNPDIIELLASIITRSKTNKEKYIRHTGKDYKDFGINGIDFVPLTSIFYSVHSTVNRLAGAYFADGLVGALVNPTEKTAKIESILRA